MIVWKWMFHRNEPLCTGNGSAMHFIPSTSPHQMFSRLSLMPPIIYKDQKTVKQEPLLPSWLTCILSNVSHQQQNLKHCQRHNGPEGWVHITSSNTNLDQISFSESRPRFVFDLAIWTQPSGPLCLWQCFNATSQMRGKGQECKNIYCPISAQLKEGHTETTLT